MTFAAAYVAWLVGAIERSDQDPRFIPIIKVVIGHPGVSLPLFETHQLSGNKSLPPLGPNWK